MPRVTKSVTAKAKHKKVLSATKGHYGARSRLFRTAKQSNIKSLQYAFRDRKNRKRAFRSLWIARINAASRALGVSYSKLINGMTTKEIRHGNAPARNFVYDMKSSGISATFYADKFMRERTFFEMWQKAAFSNSTHNMNYYNDYVAPLDIFALGSFAR